MTAEIQHTFPVERLKCSAPGVLVCGFRAFQNLFVWAGLEPPPLEDVYEFLRLRRERVGTDPLEEIRARGLRVDETAFLLEAFAFPSIVALANMPAHLTAREAFDNGAEADAPLGINRWFVMLFPVDRKAVA